MNIKNAILHYIRYKQLKYGHVQRMDEVRLPQKTLEWCLPGRRRRRRRRRRKGRPRNLWMKEVTTGMRERGIDDLE